MHLTVDRRGLMSAIIDDILSIVDRRGGALVV